MAEQTGRSASGGSSGCGESASGGSRGPTGDQGSFAEVTVIDSQFQHFSSYIEVIRVFKCRLCTFCSPLEHVIASHMSEVHFPRRCFLCKQCLFVFEDRAQLVSHLDSAHGTKSIAVCFGDAPSTASGYSSPCTLRMMMTAEGEDRIQEQMMKETEALNGRVTSSTGNLASLTSMFHRSATQPNCVEHTPMESCVQKEGGRASEPPSASTNARQQQFRSSSCHPSSTNQVYSSPDINDCEARNSRHEQPEGPRNDQEPPAAASQSLASDLQVSVGSRSYIKTEPISPVRSSLSKQGQRARPYLGRSRHDPRSYMRRWSLTENSMNEDSTVSIPERMSRSFDTPGSEHLLPYCTEEREKTNSIENRGEKIHHSTHVSKEGENVSGCKEGRLAISQSFKESSDTEAKEKSVEKSKSLDTTSKGTEKGILLGVGTCRSYHSGRSVDGRPPRLVRQSVVQESPRNSPQLEVLSEENTTSGEQKEVPAGTTPCGPAENMARENFARSLPGSFEKVPGDVFVHQNSSANFRPTLRDLVSSRIERRDRPVPLSAADSLCGPIHNTSLPASRANAALFQSGRIRSYSVSEGDSQGKGTHLSKFTDAEMDTAATERDHPSSMQPRMPPGNPHMSHTLQHPYPGLVYQPYSIEGEPKHMRYYSQGPRMAGPSAMDGAPHPLQMRQENGQFPSQNQPTEDSFLYRYLRYNDGHKYRRKSISGSNLASGEAQSACLVPAHGPPRGMVPHVEGPEMIGIDRQRGLPLPPRHHLEHPFPRQGSFPAHLTPYAMMWKDKVSPNASDQRQGPEYRGSLEKEAPAGGEVLNSPNGVVLIDGKLVRAKQGEGGESNQDLAKDITRQVQQAMGVTQALYTAGDRHLMSWAEGTERPNSPDDVVDEEDLGHRRSRKSTFNIYREIPERKRKLDHEEEEKIKHSYNADGSFDYFTLTGWKAYKCDMCKKRRFKTASELQEHKQRKHGLQRNHSSQGSLNGLPEAASALTVADGNEANDSPASG